MLEQMRGLRCFALPSSNLQSRAVHIRDFDVASADHWGTVASVLAPWIRIGAWAALDGPLGAGKTTFVQHLVHQMGGGTAADVTSPTFALYHDYDTRPPIRHYDLYRAGHDLQAGEAKAMAGLDWEPQSWDRYFVLVEWSDRLPAYVPPPLWTLSIRPTSNGGRQARWRLVNPNG